MIHKLPGIKLSSKPVIKPVVVKEFGGAVVQSVRIPACHAGGRGFVFYLDENAYFFAITEHRKSITIKNEAGKGFVNAAQVGSLKIIKTSSDSAKLTVFHSV